MRWWEWTFPILMVALPLWATIPDWPHFCGWLEFSRTCGIGAIARLDILLPIGLVAAFWALFRTLPNYTLERRRWAAIWANERWLKDLQDEIVRIGKKVNR